MPYEEKKYSSKEEWQNGDRKAQGMSENPLVNLPYLKDGNRVHLFLKFKVIFETPALIVYIINKANRKELMGTTTDEQVRIA